MSCMYSETKMDINIKVNVVRLSVLDQKRKGGPSREQGERRGFDHYGVTSKDLHELKPCHLRHYTVSFKYKFIDGYLCPKEIQLL